MNVDFALMLAGLAQTFSGFTFFRQPGVPMMFFGPIWNASKYLTPPGVALWVGGQSTGTVGILIYLFTRFA